MSLPQDNSEQLDKETDMLRTNKKVRECDAPYHKSVQMMVRQANCCGQLKEREVPIRDHLGVLMKSMLWRNT
ncbi:hypothetical protein MHYP_G00127590 [Metynnis hypsauchen]